MMLSISCNRSNLEAKILNYELLGVCIDIGSRCFLIVLQNSYYCLQCTFVDSIQVSYVLQSITTIQPLQ